MLGVSRFSYIATGVAAVAMCVWPLAAAAQGVPQTSWSVAFNVQTERPLSGNLNGDATGTFAGQPTAIASRSYADIYGRFVRWHVAIGYALSTDGEIRVTYGMSRASAEETQIGTAGDAPLLALYDDFRSSGMDFGYRQYFAPMYSPVRPFVGSNLGFARVSAVQSTLRVPDLGASTSGVDFYDDATVTTFNYQVGVQVRVTYRLFVEAGIDARWQGDLDDLDGLSGTGLEGLNDISARWSLPVFVGFTYKF
jgi:hypothetical protein